VATARRDDWAEEVRASRNTAEALARWRQALERDFAYAARKRAASKQEADK
jgi:hypothetical protein